MFEEVRARCGLRSCTERVMREGGLHDEGNQTPRYCRCAAPEPRLFKNNGLPLLQQRKRSLQRRRNNVEMAGVTAMERPEEPPLNHEDSCDGAGCVHRVVFWGYSLFLCGAEEEHGQSTPLPRCYCGQRSEECRGGHVKDVRAAASGQLRSPGTVFCLLSLICLIIV